MPRRHAVLALVVAICWAVNFVVIDIGLESFPPLLFAALRFGLIAFPAVFFVPRPDVRWPAVVAVGLFICVGQFGLLFVAMNTGLPAGLASVIAPLQPVFTIPLAALALGERPSLRQVAGVSLAVAGLVAIAAGRAHGVPLAGSRTRHRVGGVVGLRECRDPSGRHEAALLAPRLVERRRTSAATRAIADLRGHRTLAKRGLLDRCFRDRCARLRRRRLDVLRVRRLVLAAVAPPRLDSCALHAARARRRDPHGLAPPARLHPARWDSGVRRVPTLGYLQVRRAFGSVFG